MIDQDYLKTAAALLNNEKGANTGDKPNRFFRPEQNKTYTLRILPNSDGRPMMMFAQHYKIADKPFVCPKKSFNQKCPVCDHIISNWKKSSTEVQEGFKPISSKPRWYSVVYVRETGEVAIWSYSPTVGKDIVALLQDKEYGDISDLKTGVDIEMKVTQDAKKKFPETAIKPKRHSSPLIGKAKDEKTLDEDAAAEILAKIPNIRESMNILSFREIEEAFLAFSIKRPDNDYPDQDPTNGDRDIGDPGAGKNSDDDIPF